MDLQAALPAAGLAVAVGVLWLVVISWKSRSVLVGILGAAGIPILLFAVAGRPTRDSHGAALLIAGIMLVIGTALFRVGHSLQQVLGREPDDEA